MNRRAPSTDGESDWLSAFPLKSASDAVDALLDAWHRLAANPRPWFNSSTHEPRLTKQLKIYLADYVAREHGLLGMWAAEDVVGKLNVETGELIEERRTDITYGWHDGTRSYKLVFEFKRLGRQKRYRDEYLGSQGLARFVTGIYARKEPIAAMVGILLAPAEEVIPKIRAALEDEDLVTSLRLRKSLADIAYPEDSSLFSKAEFNTYHDRDPVLAPPHGFIRVAHFFVSFEP